MMSEADAEYLIERIREECNLPDGMDAYKTQGRGRHYVEISAYDGDSLQERIIEVIPNEEPEVAVFHKEMPGRAEAMMDDAGPMSDIPSLVGTMIFRDIESAVTAVDNLADPKTLDAFKDKRDWLAREDALSVEGALEQATEVDTATVIATMESV